LTWCNEVLLDHNDNPFVGLFSSEAAPSLQLGCVFVRGITVPGRFWGIGMPEAGRPAQLRLNRLKTDQTANRRAMGMNRIVAEKGTIAHPNQLTNIHGAVLETNPSSANRSQPTILPAVALPGIDQEIQRAGDDLDDAFMRPAISRGINESQVRSEAHARLLLNNANNPFSLLAKEQDAIYEINEALNRIDKGTYGICEMSGDTIPEERLEALPFTRFTVACQARIERDQRGGRWTRPVRSLFGLDESAEDADDSDEDDTTTTSSGGGNNESLDFGKE
jgi:RNA polymerase-binding transcription factor DksA